MSSKGIAAGNYRAWGLSALLAAITFLLYLPAGGFEFIHLDDSAYVVDNPLVNNGITADGILRAFTTSPVSYWHPVTWISHMLDCELFGLNAGGHHFINILIHTINSVLLFIVLRQMTGGVWKSFFAAALFAWHPLHVESVAWVSERKDVLYALFWMLTLLFYVLYVQRNRNGFFLLSLLSGLLAMMAKPMAVTLPFALLLLDVWPLQRFRAGSVSNPIAGGSPQIRLLLMEKLPLFMFAAFVCIQTVRSSKQNAAVMLLEQLGILPRITNAVIAYGSYLGKMVWPVDLAVIYPHPHQLRVGWAIVSAGLLLLITLAVILRQKKQPYLAIGWLWYLGTLVPVIGILQVGIQAMADRYTYIPLVGIFLIIAWGLEDLVKVRSILKPLVVAVCCIALLGCLVLSRLQIDRWKNSVTLFTHTLAVTQNNWKAHFALGCALADRQEFDTAHTQFTAALSLAPDKLHTVRAHCRLGEVYSTQKNYDQAAAQFQEALKYDPDCAAAWLGLGKIYEARSNPQEALANYRKALVLSPQSPLIASRIIWILSTYPDSDVRDGPGAVALAEQYLDNSEQDADYLCSLAAAYAETGRYEEAAAAAQKGLAIADKRRFDKNDALIELLDNCLQEYQTGRAYRDTLASKEREL